MQILVENELKHRTNAQSRLRPDVSEKTNLSGEVLCFLALNRDDPALDSQAHSFGPARNVELAENRADVELDGVL